MLLFCTYKVIRLPSYCENWDKGLSSKLEYSDEYCNVSKPLYCWGIIMDGTLNMSKGSSCKFDTASKMKEAIDMTYQNYELENNSGVNYLGWADIKDFDVSVRLNEHALSTTLTKTAKAYPSV